MKKINEWLKKFFRIGKGDDVELIKVTASNENELLPRVAHYEYRMTVYRNALKEGSTIIIDHNKKTVTFKMI